MKTWDVVIAGGGIIGISLARELQKQGASVLVVERGEPGREASHAAAGMLAYCDLMLPTPLRPLAEASAAMYPEFVHEVEDESGMRVDLRATGTITYSQTPLASLPDCMRPLDVDEIAHIEPRLAYAGEPAYWTPEGWVDPRALTAASVKAAKHRGIDVASGSPVTRIEVDGSHGFTVKTDKTSYRAGAVVNCCGAWAGQVPPVRIPTRPIKGQMLCVVSSEHGFLRHAVRAPEVYVVPRSDGRILIGSTLEDVGFNKRVDPDTIQHLHQAAANLIPGLGEMRMLETWAGLRPGTPDALPVLGLTEIPNYFAATGHYRDGILLAPVTALVMSQVIRGCRPDIDLSAFSLTRF